MKKSNFKTKAAIAGEIITFLATLGMFTYFMIIKPSYMWVIPIILLLIAGKQAVLPRIKANLFALKNDIPLEDELIKAMKYKAGYIAFWSTILLIFPLYFYLWSLEETVCFYKMDIVMWMMFILGISINIYGISLTILKRKLK
jgi:hypothetical protein